MTKIRAVLRKLLNDPFIADVLVTTLFSEYEAVRRPTDVLR